MVLIYEQDLTHYRASFYDYLASQMDEKILVLYGSGEPDSRHIVMKKGESRMFESIKIKRAWFANKIYIQSLSQVKHIIRNNDISCIIHRGAIRNLSLLFELDYFKKKNIPIIIRGIGFSVRRRFNPKTNWLDKLHKKIVDSCDIYLCYTDGSKKILDKYCDPNKVSVAINTLNSDILINHFDRLTVIGKDKIKSDLGLKKDKYIVHVGRLSKRKKIDKLLDIFSHYKEQNNNTGLILIGDGQEMGSLKLKVEQEKIEDVIFTGALSPESIKTSEFIFSSDVVVVPGNLGLSVNHAFLLGKPVIGHVIEPGMKQAKDYIHGPEHEYLINNYNGITLIDDSIENYTVAIDKIMKNSFYAENAFKYGREKLTVQKMAVGYINAINKVKNK